MSDAGNKLSFLQVLSQTAKGVQTTPEKKKLAAAAAWPRSKLNAPERAAELLEYIVTELGTNCEAFADLQKIGGFLQAAIEQDRRQDATKRSCEIGVGKMRVDELLKIAIDAGLPVPEHERAGIPIFPTAEDEGTLPFPYVGQSQHVMAGTTNAAANPATASPALPTTSWPEGSVVRPAAVHAQIRGQQVP